ncbi:hypothetical protein FKW77_007088 [Venturia effusa]|uniref:INO80 complex subunit F domain-containing protein n=1 Tax=Venturia effusa TaxID=50376 RepID=A0A517LHJ3_9PEZI|nr:hypothetical protein FKW77_007088 [Venturia effusa]
MRLYPAQLSIDKQHHFLTPRANLSRNNLIAQSARSFFIMQAGNKMPEWAIKDRVMHGVSANSPLPPSVETAYYRKCIELKRRINEIEENNDSLRVRKMRTERAILKMRLERGFLLERIAQTMKENPDDSDQSNSPPPTPQDKPLRSKRGNRAKATPPPSASASVVAGNHTSPSAGPSHGAFLVSSHPGGTPDATANRLNQQFFAGYPGPPITTPPALLPAHPTAGPTSMNGASGGVLPPLSQYLPPGSGGQPPTAYTPGYDARRENGEGPPVQAAEGYRPPRGEANGQDVEMTEASAPGFGASSGGGFTAVNR